MKTVKDPVSRLAQIEALLGPQIQRAEQAADKQAAIDRAKLLAERTRRLAELDAAQAEAQARHAAAKDRSVAAATAASAAQLAANETWTACVSHDARASKARRAFDDKLLDLGLRAIDGATVKLHDLATYCRARYERTPVLWRNAERRFVPTGKTVPGDSTPEAALEVIAAALAELDGLRYDATVSPATIETRCRAAIARVLTCGAREFWSGLQWRELDLSEFADWLKRTADRDPVHDIAGAD